MYKELMGVKLDVIWKKLFFCNYARPRAIFTFWMACLGRLPTKDRLQIFGIITYGKCCFCDEPESIDHLFYDCRITTAIWVRVLKWLQIHHQPGAWVTELGWITQKSKGKAPNSKLLKMASTECLYAIWTWRNKIIFKDEQLHRDLAKDICNKVAARSAKNRLLDKEVQKLDGRV